MAATAMLFETAPGNDFNCREQRRAGFHAEVRDAEGSCASVLRGSWSTPVALQAGSI